MSTMSGPELPLSYDFQNGGDDMAQMDYSYRYYEDFGAIMGNGSSLEIANHSVPSTSQSQSQNRNITQGSYTEYNPFPPFKEFYVHNNQGGDLMSPSNEEKLYELQFLKSSVPSYGPSVNASYYKNGFFELSPNFGNNTLYGSGNIPMDAINHQHMHTPDFNNESANLKINNIEPSPLSRDTQAETSFESTTRIVPAHSVSYNPMNYNTYTPVRNSAMTGNDVKQAYGALQIAPKKYKLVRGVSSSGSTTRPPKNAKNKAVIYFPVELEVRGASFKEICCSQWSPAEIEDGRRIVRIEKTQDGKKLYVDFSVVGSANESPTTLPAPEGTDVIEVSCLRCKVNPDELQDKTDVGNIRRFKLEHMNEFFLHYITSVEVIEMVELLIGAQYSDSTERRKERGRIRSNLVPFWSKKPISSRMEQGGNTASLGARYSNHDYRIELAKRIMSYEIRKPRGFDREVRILEFEKLMSSLKRAMQSYYVEVPRLDILNYE